MSSSSSKSRKKRRKVVATETAVESALCPESTPQTGIPEFVQYDAHVSSPNDGEMVNSQMQSTIAAFTLIRDDIQKMLDTENSNVSGVERLHITRLLNSLEAKVQSLKQALEGRKCLFIGDNGTGKSWIIDIILLLTQIDAPSYASQEWNDHRKRLEQELEAIDELPRESISGKVVRNTDMAQTRDSEIESAADLARVSSFCEGDTLGSKGPNFLMPQPNQSVAGSTTPVAVSLSYGHTWHYVAEFHDEDWARMQIRSYLRTKSKLNQCSSPEEKRELISSREYKFSKTCFDVFVSSSFETETESVEDLASLEERIELSTNVKKLAGRNKVVAGRGKNSQSDRCFVKQYLSQQLGVAENQNPAISRCEIALLKKVRCFVPCAILRGGGVITDSPGTNDADPLKAQSLEHAVEEHDVIIAVCLRKLSSQESLKSFLVNKVVPRLVADCTSNRLVVMHYYEPTDAKNNYEVRDTFLSDCSLQQMPDMDTASMAELKTIIRDECSCHSLAENYAAQIMNESIFVFTALPTLFASLQLNQTARIRENFEKTVNLTNGWILLGLIDWIGSDNCRRFVSTIKEELDKMLEWQPEVLEDTSGLNEFTERAHLALTNIKPKEKKGLQGGFDKAVENASKECSEYLETEICKIQLDQDIAAMSTKWMQVCESVVDVDVSNLVNPAGQKIGNKPSWRDLYGATLGMVYANRETIRIALTDILSRCIEITANKLWEAFKKVILMWGNTNSVQNALSKYRSHFLKLFQECAKNAILGFKRGRYGFKSWSRKTADQLLYFSCDDAMEKHLQSLHVYVPSAQELRGLAQDSSINLVAQAFKRVKDDMFVRRFHERGCWKTLKVQIKNGYPFELAKLFVEAVKNHGICLADGKEANPVQSFVDRAKKLLLGNSVVDGTSTSSFFDEVDKKVKANLELLRIFSAVGGAYKCGLWENIRDETLTHVKKNPETEHIKRETPLAVKSSSTDALCRILKKHGLIMDMSVPEDNNSLYYALARCLKRIQKYNPHYAMYYRQLLCLKIVEHYGKPDRRAQLKEDTKYDLDEFVENTVSNNFEDLIPGDIFMVRQIPLLTQTNLLLWHADLTRPLAIYVDEKKPTIQLGVTKGSDGQPVFKSVVRQSRRSVQIVHPEKPQPPPPPKDVYDDRFQFVFDTNALYDMIPQRERNTALLRTEADFILEVFYYLRDCMRIYIPLTVMDELEQAKSSRNSNKRNMSRSVNTMLSKATSSKTRGSLPIYIQDYDWYKELKARFASDKYLCDKCVITSAGTLYHVKQNAVLVTRDGLMSTTAKYATSLGKDVPVVKVTQVMHAMLKALNLHKPLQGHQLVTEFQKCKVNSNKALAERIWQQILKNL